MTVAELRAILADHPAERTVVLLVPEITDVGNMENVHYDIQGAHTDQPPRVAPVLVLDADWPGADWEVA